ncbi:hypothetical protein GCM10028805_41310 [Spirosoma harenae]
MTFLFFAAINSKEKFHEHSLGAENLEDCFDLLSKLAAGGWQFLWIKLYESPTQFMYLPVEAFDGVLIAEPVKQLQDCWKEILTSNGDTANY